MLAQATATKNALPRWRSLRTDGDQLPRVTWENRHRFIVWCTLAHAPALALFGWWRGWPAPYWLAEPLLIVGIIGVACLPQASRRMRGGLAALALVTSSAVLVQLSGGFIEAHFHYFIVVALVALYEDYVPFLLAILYVAVDHGLVGSLAPDWVYNHEDAAGKPWKWAGLHAAAILGESIALLGFWMGAQQVRARGDVVLDSTGEGIVGTSDDGRITFANPAAGALLGRAPKDLEGERLAAWLPEAAQAIGQRTTGVFLSRVPRPEGQALIEWTSNPSTSRDTSLGTVFALRDITGRRSLEDRIVAHARQNAAIARLGQFALETRELDAIFQESTRTVAGTLGVDMCKVLEILPTGDRLLLRAGVGWQAGLVGAATVPANLDSQAGYTLAANRAVIVEDLRTETRFQGPALLHEHGVVSGLSVPIVASRQPWGVLGTHARQARPFTPDDVNFVQAVANLVATSIERQRAEEGLHTRNRQQAVVASLGHEALSGERLDAFLGRCAREVAAALDVGFCKILELEPEGDTLLLRAGHGWRAGLVGHARVPADLHSQAGYALRHDGPVIVRDVGAETRFTDPALLKEHGIVSGISVLIKGRQGPFGVLGAHADALREFTHDDIHFLQAVANLIATAVERHRVEDELLQHRLNLEGLVESRTAQLLEANRELEAFSYTVSHDLRSPLRSIDGFTQILRKRYGDRLPPEAHELMDYVHDGAIKMGDLIESVLTLSRVSRKPMRYAPVDLSAAAVEVLSGLARQSPERKVQWEVAEGLTTVGDEGLLRLVLENLLSNAWKFTSRTEEAVIRFRRDTDDPASFVVEDNGAGFSMADARDLFQPFHRLHDARQFPGTGIGLATVARIVQRHGGNIRADAMPGRGARFIFSIGVPGRSGPEMPEAEEPAQRPMVRLVEADSPRR